MLTTRLTKRLGIDHPVIQAPMAFAAGGRLAAAVSGAGGLGMIGGAYDAGDWIAEQMDVAGNQSVGCGFITWKLREHPQALEQALDRDPAAIFLSFGDPAEFLPAIRATKVPLICQVQTLRDAAHAIDLGAEIIVAQGAEAGGHGEKRATFTLVPEVADHIARHAPEVLLCAAGGVADGRGLAAALMLGADGVVVGSRFWASEEALVHPAMREAALKASGDDTLRSTVTDIMRGYDWPKRYTGRVLRNDFTDRWHDDPDGLRAALAQELPRWQAAVAAGDARTANAFVGEVAGLICAVSPAADILRDIVQGAETALGQTFTR
ncbi:nitronate monooxygenase [Sulfitobacter sp. KE29]|uniref:NAD(P)H-dependent flavin oxidoreductase n=1 Tax=unclassified Sulfitobacter TaxID=196795 RepID=UPI0007C260F5|nr:MULTISPECIES: nitronate monooxygenase [unclassified Sulfitobacter]KZY53994.1 oxidoreductase [Sulfitobacter sp. HI0054]MBO9438069.1 nitronate monooxygenase [Sulfitobacter sp. R18_2]MDF3418620.1 nitronate monooxygenase [Sulfitobacter sp. Ks38]MDF3426294.1 nitronate monooxygenase [Sulfitobacter sp. KE29]MDF3429875.1 nitronate monooxygenase [Sulfitobacter sp. S46]